MYLQQKCFDDSVNKTIFKPRLALAALRRDVYVEFSRSKIPRSSAARWQPIARLQSSVAYTISEKAIRFRHPAYDPDRAQKLISSSTSRHLSTRATFHPNPCTRFSNLANRQTDKQSRAKSTTSSFVGGKKSEVNSR